MIRKTNEIELLKFSPGLKLRLLIPYETGNIKILLYLNAQMLSANLEIEKGKKAWGNLNKPECAHYLENPLFSNSMW